MSMELFSFQDLMSFGMFIIALLTFISLNNRKQPLHRKTTPIYFGRYPGGFLHLIFWQPTLWAVVLFHFQYTTTHSFMQHKKLSNVTLKHLSAHKNTSTIHMTTILLYTNKFFLLNFALCSTISIEKVLPIDGCPLFNDC